MFKIESYITPIIINYIDKYVKDFRPQNAQVMIMFTFWFLLNELSFVKYVDLNEFIYDLCNKLGIVMGWRSIISKFRHSFGCIAAGTSSTT